MRAVKIKSCGVKFGKGIFYTPPTDLSTVTVCLKWRLHFEFVTAKSALPEVKQPNSASDSVTWHGPSDIDVETMIWDMPIKVFATSPIHASAVSLLRNETDAIV